MASSDSVNYFHVFSCIKGVVLEGPEKSSKSPCGSTTATPKKRQRSALELLLEANVFGKVVNVNQRPWLMRRLGVTPGACYLHVISQSSVFPNQKKYVYFFPGFRMPTMDNGHFFENGSGSHRTTWTS